MKFIKKKNFQEGEELLYTPRLHWMYTIRHMVLSLPYFLVLLVLWFVAESSEGSSVLMHEQEGIQLFRVLFKHLVLVSIIIVLLVFVWRIFRYLCTEYGVTNRRLIIKKGIIRLVIAEIPTDRIESIYCRQGLMGRIFNYGTVCIGGIGGTMPIFYMVSRPYAFRRKIVDIIEKNKTITVIHGSLPKAEPVEKPKSAAKEEPIYRYGTFVRVVPGNK